MGSDILLLSMSEFSDVSVVITLQFLKENFSLNCLDIFKESQIQKIKNILASGSQFLFDYLLIFLCLFGILSSSFIFFFTLNETYDSPSSSPSSDSIFECYRKNVTLINSEFLIVLLTKFSDIIDHFCTINQIKLTVKSITLLSQSSKI